MSPIISKIGIYAVIAAVLSAIIFFGYRHYTGLLSEINTLTANNATLQVSFDTEKATVTELKLTVTEWELAGEEYQNQIQALAARTIEARSEIRRLNDIFGTHDLTRLAKAKPGLIERRINDGTQRVFDLLTCHSTVGNRCDSRGRPITASETDPPES